MKLIHCLLMITANLAFMGWITAFAGPNNANSLKSLESNAVHPAEASTPSKLSGRAVYGRISNETGGLYVFKAKPLAKDYSKFLNDTFEKSLNGNNAARKMDSP